MSGKNPLGQSQEPQAYEGANVVVPIGGWRLVRAKRAPTSSDKKYPVGSLWVNTLTNLAYILTSAPGNWFVLGSLTGNSGNVVLPSAGNKIISSSVASTTSAGANSFGTVTLVGGTATISTTAITASSIVFLTRQSVGSTGAAALGELSIGTIVAGTSFVINAWSQANATSLAATDVSSIGWMIVN